MAMAHRMITQGLWQLIAQWNEVGKFFRQCTNRAKKADAASGNIHINTPHINFIGHQKSTLHTELEHLDTQFLEKEPI